MRVVELLGDDAASRSRAVAFVTAIESVEGSRPLSDHLWADLRRDERPAPVIALAADETGPIAMAQMSHANETWSLEAFARADVPDAATVMLDAAETALDRRRAAGAGTVVWWVDDPTDVHRRFAAAQGLAPTRSLHEMRRPLPHEQHAEVATRAFRPGVDDDAWLAVNNRAFADHAEQGGWTLDTLAARMDEPWFDPAGFRLHEVDGRLAAFCWTKLHAPTTTTPPLGEIYVIAVDPDFHGRGLGKQLTLAGLDSISARGVELANLYVDADNDAAVGLYERLGFSIHRTRRAFVGELTPQPDHEEDT